ncbi:MAG: SIS domain-containing protein [Erysipelotrichaceae bacterium]
MIFNINEEVLQSKSAYWTAKEISQQPDTWKKTLNQITKQYQEISNFINEILKTDDFEIIFTGAGTSEFVGNAVFSYLNKLTNYKAKSYATTDIVATPENYLNKDRPTLLVSFGRSGNSPESVAAVELANVVCNKIKHLFITCNHEGALSKFALASDNCYAINLTPETHDKGFAMTSSFTNMYLAALLVFLLKTKKVDEQMSIITKNVEELLYNDFRVFSDLVNDFDFNRIVYLGSNSNKGIAQESALKMLELSAGNVATMYDSPMGFRHGPKSIINDQTLVVVYLSDDEYTRQYELDVIKEMSTQRKGNKILALSGYHDTEVEVLVDYYHTFFNEIKLDNIFLGLEYIVVAHLLSLFKSMSYDITPDNPCPSGEVNRVVAGVTIYPYK